MRLSSVALARVLSFVDLTELNPQGRIFLPALIPKIVERFSFQKYPTNFQEYDLSKGVEFELGYAGLTTILKMVVYNDGIALDVRSNTTDAKAILVSMLEWLRDEFGLEFSSNMIKRWGYLSNIHFYSDLDLTGLNPILNLAANKISNFIGQIGRGHHDYRVTKLAIDLDRFHQNPPQAAFRIETIIASPFEDQKFFSEAPLTTELHIELINEIEDAVLGHVKSLS